MLRIVDTRGSTGVDETVMVRTLSSQLSNSPEHPEAFLRRRLLTAMTAARHELNSGRAAQAYTKPRLANGQPNAYYRLPPEEQASHATPNLQQTAQPTSETACSFTVFGAVTYTEEALWRLGFRAHWHCVHVSEMLRSLQYLCTVYNPSCGHLRPCLRP